MRTYLVAALGFLCMSVGIAGAQSAFFARTLRLGDAGEDVLLLQQILNRNVKTKIAKTGPGSPGNETGYFGALTKKAVIKFQEIHAKELLAKGAKADGSVGAKMLALLNRIAGPTPKEEKPLSPTVKLSHMSGGAVNPGSSITIYGEGFTGTTMPVRFGKRFITASVVNSTTLALTIPGDTSSGVYAFEVIDEDLSSNPLEVRVLGALTTEGADVSSGELSVKSIYPTEGPLGTTVFVAGDGFSKLAENTLYVGYDKIDHLISIDGKTLSFTIPSYLPQFDFTGADFSGIERATLPLFIYVVNNQGMSNAQLFNLIIK